ncbi:MAG: hypothetical protein J5529_04335 [Prevotella sp.]|nr:hypothetical protein [Prevotella sp.]
MLTLNDLHLQFGQKKAIWKNENGLKGQKQLARGNALGKRVSQQSPRKGKSIMTSIRLLPFQGGIYSFIYPGRCPGLVSRWPFYKSLLLGILKTSFRLLSLNRDFQAVFAPKSILTARKNRKPDEVLGGCAFRIINECNQSENNN